MNLFGKFALAVTFLIAVVLGGSRLFLHVAERRHLVDQWEQRQRETIKRFSGVCREAYLNQNDVTAFQYIQSITAEPYAVYAMFVSPKNVVQVHSDVKQMGRRLSDEFSENVLGSSDIMFQTLNVPGTGVVTDVSMPVRYGENVVGYCRVGYSQDVMVRETEAVLEDMARRWNLVTVWALFLGLGGALILASFLVRPIRVLGRGAKLIGEGVLTHRVALQRRDELGELARQFNEMASALAQLDEMKDSFVASVSHELRSPLTAIKSHIGLLTSEFAENGSADARESLGILFQSANRLEGFVNDILDLAKIEAGMFSLNLQPCSIQKVLTETVRLFEPQAAVQKCRLALQLPDDLPLVRADPDRVGQVLTNLVSNAFKFTPEGGQILLSAVGNGRFVECAVADSGVGIPLESLPKIFTKFEQGKNRALKGKGTGLGLAIAKGIVDAHKGRIWVESRPGEGTVFRFCLPVADAQEASS